VPVAAFDGLEGVHAIVSVELHASFSDELNVVHALAAWPHGLITALLLTPWKVAPCAHAMHQLLSTPASVLTPKVQPCFGDTHTHTHTHTHTLCHAAGG